MCARPGYSTVKPPEEAPSVMLKAMLTAVQDVEQKKGTLLPKRDVHVYIFLPESPPLLPLPKAKAPSPRILFTAEDMRNMGPLMGFLRGKGVEVLWRENVPNTVVADEALSQDVACIVTSRRRDPEGDHAGVD